MQITELSLTNWRNYSRAELAPHPLLNVLLGANGQGKTNLMEAVWYLAKGRNFRGNKDAELIRWQTPYLRLEGAFRLEGSSRLFQESVYVDSARKKRMTLNGVAYRRMSQLPARLRAVLFTPDDLAVVKGGPAERRRFLDDEVVNLNDACLPLRRGYDKVLSQRNELLREIRAGRARAADLEVWDLQLVRYGSALCRERLALLRALVPRARRVHARLCGADLGFDVTYQSSLGPVPAEETALQARFFDLLRDNRDEEITRGLSLVGPHRDDLLFYEGGADLRVYGSQGQQRTAVLAMKTAVLDVIESRFEERPLFLLDDVMSELDPSRQQAVMDLVVEKQIQTFLTGTAIDLPPGLDYDPVFLVEAGTVTPRKPS